MERWIWVVHHVKLLFLCPIKVSNNSSLSYLLTTLIHSCLICIHTDISENLFRLQIGGQKHWNVYTKSFLSFGHNSARERHFRQVTSLFILITYESPLTNTHISIHSLRIQH